ncbi:precorrin-2 dehydrogenase [Bacillus inaquosorum]|uniref:precorrin-2 dehydrogenase n=1 Tax=Bacillus inaquosorum TaxID=483913 RepID=UPI000745EB62|nr:precorrin-2 dehydrogenase [Bacillus inaquosorum]PPA37494.1 bifunctional precorrin-2 dehydrogenase/sirohydrochlorin ferrochelatase [Bacillus subtilis]AMA52254.1 precorrin-2 dehydrogenase [Bacillus inaquosorum]MBT2191161.1 precorrin-2 dehydrogenase [Bacillus inaquosorum]MBT3118502.1 precorrin-2 dehydrogenase [Bacillus inaquosorum]MBT3121421.1 precorrin-2 dehydrogenase [Bacillus inaquosorum]
MLPLHISLEKKKVVIAGGGTIALRRLKTVLSEGADITLVSPDVEPEIKKMADNRRIRWASRTIEKEDYLDAFLIIAATDNAAVNKEIAQTASPFQLVNCVSEAELGNVYIPKIVKRGHVTVSVSTNGASPKHTKELSEKVDELIDGDFVAEVDRLYHVRRKK